MEVQGTPHLTASKQERVGRVALYVAAAVQLLRCTLLAVAPKSASFHAPVGGVVHMHTYTHVCHGVRCTQLAPVCAIYAHVTA